MWTPGGEAEERRLYKGVQESPLEQYLPLGTAVWVNHRRISASPQSSLRVQASASKSSIRRFVITEKAPTRAFSWLKAASTAFTFKTLLRHYAMGSTPI